MPAADGAAMFFAGSDGLVDWTNAAGQRMLGAGRSLAAALDLDEVPIAPAAIHVFWRDADGVQQAGVLTLEALHGGTLAVISQVAPAAGQPGGPTTVGRAPVLMTARAPQRRLAARALAMALEHDQLQVRYQPIVELASGGIVAAEAKIRWHHPRLGGLSHDALMSLGKDSGQDVALGRWLLEEAIYEATRWAEDPTLPRLGVHVTVTSPQLVSGHLAEHAALMLAATPLPGRTLCLQAPEQALSAPVGGRAANDRLRAVRDRGIRVGLTKFGIGASTLAQLQDDPVDVLRLDPSLVDGIATDSASSALVATVLSVAEKLDIVVVAAGVRDADQVTELRALGCRFAQGPHLSEALEPPAFLAAAQRAWAQPPQEPPIRTSTAAGTSPSSR
ncbi:MAG TPA: EAL domain-containing protein [Euzebya sp.]|nr:EAL domain-containing protein [Euzebya sp.]